MAEGTLSSTYNKIRRVNRFCVALSSLILLFISVSVFVDVVLRYFFNRPSLWVTEVSGHLFMYVIFLGAAYALQEDYHISVDFVVIQLKPAVRRIVNLITSIFSLIFCFVLLWQTSVMTWSAFEKGWVSPTLLSIPYVYIYISMVFGSFMLFLTFLMQSLLELRSERPEDVDK